MHVQVLLALEAILWCVLLHFKLTEGQPLKKLPAAGSIGG
jgi:hypothetical protein